MQEVIIVGAGLAGMLTAYELLNKDARVILLERGEDARESSWAGGGILSPLYPWRYPDGVNQLSQWSQSFYPELCAHLYEETGIDPQYTKSGLLILDKDPLQEVKGWEEKFSANLEIIDRATVQAIEPSLIEVPESAYWLPDVAQVRNPRLLKALKAYLLKNGAETHYECSVTGFIHSKGQLTGVTSSKGEMYADNVVVTAGAWSGQLLTDGGLKAPPVEPVRGQMLLFKTDPGQLQRIILSDGHYIIPRRDGRVLVGSTMEYVGFEKVTTKQAFNELKSVASRLFPVLEDAEIERHWAGLRPGSSTGVPYIGQIGGVSGLYINAGHFRNGVVMGPASAHKIAQMILKVSKTYILN